MSNPEYIKLVTVTELDPESEWILGDTISFDGTIEEFNEWINTVNYIHDMENGG